VSRAALLGGVLGSGPLGPQRPAATRAPLGPFPPGTYDRTPPPTLPAGRDIRYYRGNFCGIRIPGAPLVPGAEARNPDCVMACLLDNYPPDIQERFLQKYVDCGYTHLQRSVGHALGYGSSLASYIALSARARSQYGLLCDHWMIAAESPGFANDQDGAYWAPLLGPIIDQLVGAGVMDLCCPSWQMDGVNRSAPGNATISIIAFVADRLPPEVPVFTHWINEAMAWWKVVGHHTDGSDIGEVWVDRFNPGGVEVKDRWTWWQAMQPYLTGAHHQGNTTLARTNPQEYQGRQRDTLNAFSDGRMGQSRRLATPQDFRLNEYECTAQDQFDGNCTEDEGDLVGYILACTKADGADAWIGGYGNGARRPDGTAL
jgi:hypothetical protein